MRGNGEAVLVIDDAELQRRIASEMLRELGYRVITAASGREALEMLRENPADLLLLDMIMPPGMDGLETYRRVLECHPGQRAVIASAGGPDIVLWKSQGKAEGRKGHPLRCHQETVTALRYAPNASALVSGDRSGRLCLWDPKGSLLHVEELGSEINVISWSHDSQRFVCGTIDGLLRAAHGTLPLSGSHAAHRDVHGRFLFGGFLLCYIHKECVE